MIDDEILERFWRRVDKKLGGCWIWTGQPASRYPTLKINRKMHTVHRLSYRIHKGEIPPGLCVCHRCDVMRCVNPDHLFLATSQENTADKVAKGRQATGEHINSKLTPDDVRTIRHLWATTNYTMEQLGDRFVVSDSCIDFVVNRKSWKHVN